MNTPHLGDKEFRKISRLVLELCGINLHEGKKELVRARLGKRLREGNFRSFSDYCHYVTTTEGEEELISMIDSLSTNLTSFFREEGHFRKLRTILPSTPGAFDRNTACMSPLRIWSAGCSTGEEPYSLAITVKESINGGSAPEAKILATDISTKVLKTAMAGVFLKEKLTNVSPAIVKKYFQEGRGSWEGYYRLKKDIRGMITFTRFNLMDVPPPNFLFDIIFCRNVMIYFERVTQEALIGRFFNCLKQGGYLFIGHSESLMNFNHDFNYIEPSIYRKCVHG